MAENIQSIQRRILSVKNTQQITKAMKMVAAAKLRKAEERATSAKLYAEKIEEVLGNLMGSVEGYSNPLFSRREVGKIRVMLVTSDKGLCGGFNNNLIRFALSFLQKKSHEKNEIELQLIGKKGIDFFRYREFTISGSAIDVNGAKITPFTEDLSGQCVREFKDGEFDELYVFYNKFISVVRHSPVNVKLLPLSDIENTEAPNTAEHIYEPSREEVLETLIPKYFFTRLQGAFLDSEAAEHSSRMTAMDAATNNARDLIKFLTLKRNRIRQASITNELIEIVSAAEALNG